MDIPKKATKEQVKAMTETEGNIRVSSVPGSGKTFVLTYRIAYLITELFVEPSSIVALTFTNKAAAQMKHRLREIVGDNANCFTGTFHGYCNMFLKEEIHRVTFPKTFTILDKKAQTDMIKNVAEAEGCSLFKALGKLIAEGEVTQKAVIGYYEDIVRLHGTYKDYSCTDIVNQCLDMGYREALEQDIDQTRLDNVSELIRTITALEEDNQEKVELADLLSHFALFSAQDEDGEYNVVRVMTIHTSKGLEFDTVFVPGLVEGQFPSNRLRNEDEFEEERRLLYVAITRAKNMLYLSSYRKRDARFYVRPSAFLSDIDTNLLECINGSRIVIHGETEQMLPKAVFAVGDKVRHKVFGVGEIIKIDKMTQTYEIQFENIRGTRRIMFRAELNSL